MDWDDLRAGLGMPYDKGTWFVVRDEFARVDPDHPNKERRIMLTSPLAPDVVPVVAIRSASSKRPLRHPAHEATDGHGRCPVNLAASIPRWTRSVAIRHFDAETYSCVEPTAEMVEQIVAWVFDRPRGGG